MSARLCAGGIKAFLRHKKGGKYFDKTASTEISSSPIEKYFLKKSIYYFLFSGRLKKTAALRFA
ncbi:hypothetical protein [Neisseria dentiae]|uniref:hypothetical protein n=1 Tax=Neisseria dentiae TaxID=194197 RepID=UPI0011814E3B|nr:hypothetical protein [Neisseria dentiae]QMT44649.1 hypothetical protein H3L92_09365 [Neisseria dentiae]